MMYVKDSINANVKKGRIKRSFYFGLVVKNEGRTWLLKEMFLGYFKRKKNII